jgi:hypothetical protein
MYNTRQIVKNTSCAASLTSFWMNLAHQNRITFTKPDPSAKK